MYVISSLVLQLYEGQNKLLIFVIHFVITLFVYLSLTECRVIIPRYVKTSILSESCQFCPHLWWEKTVFCCHGNTFTTTTGLLYVLCTLIIWNWETIISVGCQNNDWYYDSLLSLLLRKLQLFCNILHHRLISMLSLLSQSWFTIFFMAFT